MAENQAFDGDHLGATTFSQLLFAVDDHDDGGGGGGGGGGDKNLIFNYSAAATFAIENPPKMLCFGNKEEQQKLGFVEPSFSKSRQISGLTCSDSSSASSGNNGGATKPAFPKSDSKLKKRNGLDPGAAAIKAAPSSTQRASKKIKAEATGSAGHARRKEKLGERITALQQLVSPFGKTDTASVLHEAMGYIKFLQEQVQVLCSPYLQHLPSLSPTGGRENDEAVVTRRIEDLRSRGLCLIPVDCSLHLADCTVADFWSPTMAMGRKL